jgi:hypothetical protein
MRAGRGGRHGAGDPDRDRNSDSRPLCGRKSMWDADGPVGAGHPGARRVLEEVSATRVEASAGLLPRHDEPAAHSGERGRAARRGCLETARGPADSNLQADMDRCRRWRRALRCARAARRRRGVLFGLSRRREGWDGSEGGAAQGGRRVRIHRPRSGSLGPDRVAASPRTRLRPCSPRVSRSGEPRKPRSDLQIRRPEARHG